MMSRHSLDSSRKIGFYVARTAGAMLLFALAAVFYYSAYTKCGVLVKGWKLYANDNAFDNFQWSFLDFGFSSLFLTGILARLMIGFELLLALFLTFHIFLRQITYRAVMAVLAFFIIYLLVVLAKQGNNGNCGCFGDSVAMTPLAAIVKNVIMIAVTAILGFLYPVKPYRRQEYVALMLGLVAFSLPFIINPMYTGTAPVKAGKPINLAPLYAFAPETPAPAVDLRKGKHIISFMSLTCPHCRKAAHLLSIIHHEHPDIPLFMVLDGPQPLMKDFFDATQSADVPYEFFKHNAEFDGLIKAGLDSGALSGVPAIYWVNNDTVEYRSTYYQLDPKIMEHWMRSSDPIRQN